MWRFIAGGSSDDDAAANSQPPGHPCRLGVARVNQERSLATFTLLLLAKFVLLFSTLLC